jgi:amino acid transporter
MIQPMSALPRRLKGFETLLITLSGITPASGVFVIAPTLLQQAGSGALLSLLLAAVVGVCLALVYAELASAYPLTGGEYTMVGRVLGAAPGFIVLGVNLITLVLSFAAISLGVATYLKPFIPSLSPVLIGVATVTLTTLLSIFNIRFNALITGGFLLLEMGALAILLYLGFAHPQHGVLELLTQPMLLDVSSGQLVPAGFGAIGLAATIALWAYNGYGQAVYLGEETHNAPSAIARVILWALAIAVISVALPITAVLVGSADLAALLQSPDMLMLFATTLGGQSLGVVLSALVALAIFNANIAIALMIARQFFSTGRDALWSAPINRVFTQLHRRFHSPWLAALCVGLLAMAACFIPQTMLFMLIGTSLVFIYSLLCVAVMVGRRNGTTRHGRYRMPLFPLPPLLGLLALGYVSYANFLDAAVGRLSLWATLGMVLLAALYYYGFLRHKKHGLKVF